MQQRNKSDNLGMNLDIPERGVMQVDMIPYIKNIFIIFPEEIKGSCPSPVSVHLFKIWDKENARYLTEE